MRHALTHLRRALTVVAVTCLGGWATVKLYAYASTVRNEAALEQLIGERRNDVALRPPYGGGANQWQPAEGVLLGRIDVPRIGVSGVILQGSGERWLDQAAGHLPDTALPGTDGNAAIAGHRDSVFRGLGEIRVGDTIEVTTPWVTRLYRVDAIRIVGPTDTGVLAPTTSPRLTLITCYPFHYIGPAPSRFVVQASAVWSGTGVAVVPPRPAVTLRLPEAPTRLRAPEHRARATRTQRAAAQEPGGSHLPVARALAHVPPPSALHPPKVSWLRRLFHLGPKRTTRR